VPKAERPAYHNTPSNDFFEPTVFIPRRGRGWHGHSRSWSGKLAIGPPFWIYSLDNDLYGAQCLRHDMGSFFLASLVSLR